MTDHMVVDNRPLRFMVHDHQTKSLVLQDAIMRQGGELVMKGADLTLMDHDGPDYYKRIIDSPLYNIDKVVIYPHGADAWPAWDGSWDVHPKTVAYLAISQGVKDAMIAYGYPRDIHVIGWYWSPIEEFKPVDKMFNMEVLFAPVHPLNNGFLLPELGNRNVAIYSHLLDWEMNLRVRTVGDPSHSGLFPALGVTWERGGGMDAWESIRQADVVIANGTFAWMAIAMGKPTIMYDGDLVYQDRGIEAKHGGHSEYPIQFNYDGIPEAWVKDPETVSEWKERWIGEPLDEENLARVLRSIYENGIIRG